MCVHAAASEQTYWHSWHCTNTSQYLGQHLHCCFESMLATLVVGLTCTPKMPLSMPCTASLSCCFSTRRFRAASAYGTLLAAPCCAAAAAATCLAAQGGHYGKQRTMHNRLMCA